MKKEEKMSKTIAENRWNDTHAYVGDVLRAADGVSSVVLCSSGSLDIT